MRALPLSLLCLVPALAAAPNEVLNGDFSQVEKGVPVGWGAYGDSRTVTQRLEVGEDNGTNHARLVCTRCDKAGGASHAMLAQLGKVRLTKGTLYQFSCRARAENLAGGIVSVAIRDTTNWQSCGLSGEISLTDQWSTFTKRFRATQTTGEHTRLQFWYQEPGTFCVADVRLVEASAVRIEMTDTIPPSDSPNLIPNASFECGVAGWSSLGRSTGWGNLAGLHGELVADRQAPHGDHCLRIPLGGGRTPTLYFDYLKPVANKQLQPLAANLGWFAVEVGKPYTLSCYMRANADDVPAVLGLHLRNPDGSRGDRRDDRHSVTLSKEWQRCAFTFRPTKRAAFVTVGPALETDQSVVVDVDAVQFEAGEEATPFVLRHSRELAVEPSAPAGIFVAGSGGFLQFRSSAARTDWGGIRLTATDYFGRPATLPGPDRTGRVPIPPNWRGHYQIRVAVPAGSDMPRSAFPISIVPKPVCTDTVIGINHAFADALLIRLARKAGVTWYRDWSLKWEDLEPKQGEFHWDVGDTQIDRVLAEQVNLMALMPPFPSANWCSEAPAALATPGYRGTRLRQAWAPEKRDELGRFVGQAVVHYGNRIKVWEFLNEPVYTDYALPGKDKPEYRKVGAKSYTVQDYVDLLKLAGGAMKKADPTCRVIGGIGGWPDHYALEAVRLGCLDACDILNLHIYPGLHPPEWFVPKMEELIQAMDATGKRRPIWLTEFSYYGSDTYPRHPFIADSSSWSQERLLRDERQCADYTIRFCTLMMTFGVEKVFIHSGANAAVNGEQFECCLFDYGGAPKKIVPALATFADLMGSQPHFVETRQLGGTARCCVFDVSSGRLTVAWDPAAEGAVHVPVPDNAAACDLVGRRITAKEVTLGSSPVYLVAPR